jgi:hypothetical protein
LEEEQNQTESVFSDVWEKIEHKIRVTPSLEALWSAQPGPQQAAWDSTAYELLYGGAAFGGKSEWLLHDGLKQIYKPNYKALLLRRTFPELRELIDRSMAIFPQLGGKWNEQAKRWTFPSGAFYQMGYCENYADVHQYQGQQFAWIGFDELGLCGEERIWTYLMSRNRAPFENVQTYMRASANPGGAGHHWLKRRFIAPCDSKGTPVQFKSGSRAFIQAFMTDNIIGMTLDPDYEKRLDALPEIERQWLKYGDWNAGAGMGLAELNRDIHLIDPFEIPSHWTMFGAFDWGYNHPFAFGLFAADEDGNVYLVDSVHGRRLQPDQIAHRIIESVPGFDVRRLAHIAAGHDCWADRKARGELVPTIAEQFYELGLTLDKANISRISGVQNIRRYLTYKTPSGETFDPRFRIFKTPANEKCYDTLESRVSDPDNIEDILKTDANEQGEGGDDFYDMVRYGLASRPLNATPVQAVVVRDRNRDEWADLEPHEYTHGTIQQFGTWA